MITKEYPPASKSAGTNPVERFESILIAGNKCLTNVSNRLFKLQFELWINGYLSGGGRSHCDCFGRATSDQTLHPLGILVKHCADQRTGHLDHRSPNRQPGYAIDGFNCRFLADSCPRVCLVASP